jgi:hypothetical protein
MIVDRVPELDLRPILRRSHGQLVHPELVGNQTGIPRDRQRLPEVSRVRFAQTAEAGGTAESAVLDQVNKFNLYTPCYNIFLNSFNLYPHYIIYTALR